MKINTSFVVVIAFFASHGYAQVKPSAKKPASGLTHFFTGNWEGIGQFASGKPIAANVSFHLSLDSCWLVSEHADQLPNVYQATSMWGTDQLSGNLQAFIFDNFGGYRRFSSTGWTDGRVSFVSLQITARGKSFQRFVYQKLDADRFKMTYELSADSLAWREGDHLEFKRIKTDKNKIAPKKQTL